MASNDVGDTHICIQHRSLAELIVKTEAQQKSIDEIKKDLNSIGKDMSREVGSVNGKFGILEEKLVHLSNQLKNIGDQNKEVSNALKDLTDSHGQLAMSVAIGQVEFRQLNDRDKQQDEQLEKLDRTTERHGRYLWKIGFFFTVIVAVVSMLVQTPLFEKFYRFIGSLLSSK